MARSRTAPQPAERAGLYVRVSLDRSAHGLQDEILSPETQEDRCRQYCGAQGWALAEVRQDVDESAYRQHYSRRAGLMHLLERVERGELTKLVVWKFSRLSRRLQEFLEICDRVEAAGAGVVSVTEQVDTSTPAGRLIRNILASFAQFQSEEISEQIFESWMTKAKRGERPPGFAPYGTVNRKGLLEPDPDTYPRLVEIYQRFLQTGSLRAVWDSLCQQQVPPPRAQAWSLNTLRGILTNPVYIGRLEWAGESFEARWEPIVEPALWEAVQEQMALLRQGPRATPAPRLLTGFIHCGGCGRPMWTRYASRSTSGERHLRRLYWCCSPVTQRQGCPLPALDAEEAESAVWEAVLLLLGSLDLDQALAGAVARVARTHDGEAGRRRQQLEAEEERLKRSAALLVDLLADGSLTREQFREQHQRLAQRQEALRAEVGRLRRPPAATAMAAGAVLTRASEAERRELLKSLGARVEAGPGGVVLCLGDLSIDLKARRAGSTWHFGQVYQRLHYQGSSLTDKQERFIQRTYRWADKQQIARRLGRSYQRLMQVAKRLRREGRLLP